MAVTVSIPTILRTHTGGEKRVQASGSTLAAVIDDLDGNFAGIKERLIKDGKLHRFVNVYVDDEDVRFSGGLETEVADGASVTILPAVAGGDSSVRVAGGDGSVRVAGGDGSVRVAGGDSSPRDGSAPAAGGAG